ncbi:MAG: glucan biosynthesis protein, partial [Pseudomonadota bacterium]
MTDGRTAVPKPDFRAEVISLARERAAKPYSPIPDVTGGALARSYDSYRRIRFLEKNAHWYRRPPGFEVHPLPLGWLFKRPVRLLTLPRGASAPVPLTFPVSAFDDQRIGQPPAPVIADMPLSGFRINGPLNAEARSDEIIAFQGASYFRALGKNHAYGLSARGLAIGTASSRGEEFPEFQKFWIEEPALGAREIVVHALLDSQSTTGAYRFRIRPGVETLIDTDVTLFPRRDLAEIGIAPLTSMYWLGPIAQPRSFDFRPRVHDSDGLAILNGNSERIWRPINNPAALQISVFVDDAIGGFGLMQRERGFDAYQDLEARYERRPSLWIEPKSGFGPGNIILVEIPTEN